MRWLVQETGQAEKLRQLIQVFTKRIMIEMILCVNLHDLKVHEAIQRHFNIFPQSTVRFLHHQLSSMVCGRSSFFIASGANYSNFHHPPSNFPPYAHGGGGYFQGKMGLDFF